MPSSVKTEKDEKLWQRAKDLARERGFSSKDGASFWAYTQAIYQRMRKRKNESIMLEVTMQIVAGHNS